MTTKEYQIKAHTFACYTQPEVNKDGIKVPVDFVYPVMGLTEEAGEVAGKFAKAIRDDNGVITEERKAEIIKELGDVSWMLAEICTVLNVTLEEVMDKNIAKLESRRERNVIHGSGDNR